MVKTPDQAPAQRELGRRAAGAPVVMRTCLECALARKRSEPEQDF